jgi:putative endonuclease
MFYYVYVLLSLRDRKFYIGFTNNLRRRRGEHQRGKNISTTQRRPLPPGNGNDISRLPRVKLC